MAVIESLTEAKAGVMSLSRVPFQKSWAEKLQAIQLKQEVAGTSRIEGAEFTENELEAAIRGSTPEEIMTRSQKQARAAVNTYRWIAALEDDRPVTENLISEIHRRIVTGCDDDHCPPGELRADGHNVVFGSPRHRGVDGGRNCKYAFAAFCAAINGEFQRHDILIQALAVHYHIGAMHPFLDGNGRTARATEAFILQKAGLKNSIFISLSNYYYDEKENYLKYLSSVRQRDGDITEFLIFGLKGISIQCSRLLSEINKNISKALFWNIAIDLFGRLQTKRKRVIASRQLGLIDYLLQYDDISVNDLFRQMKHKYNLAEPWTGFVRDIISLRQLDAIHLVIKKREAGNPLIKLQLDWPTKVTETAFFEATRQMPKAKTLAHLTGD